MEEIWIDIKGFEGIYQISSLGRVKSFLGNGRIMKISKSIKRKDGTYCYPKVTLKGKTFRIHRLVAEHFLTKGNKTEVNHKNKNIDDNSVVNLEWCDRYENRLHRDGKPNMEIFSKNIKKKIMELVPFI